MEIDKWIILIIGIILITIIAVAYLFINQQYIIDKNIKTLQKIVPDYIYCFSEGEKITCCSLPLFPPKQYESMKERNVTFDKQILICDTYKVIDLKDKRLIIRGGG